ncbi:MAG: DNA mismatch repair protein MutS [Clostridiales bacterium]|nr:DNA mismatch repair protein MutS [Clostridiales bacterium]
MALSPMMQQYNEIKRSYQDCLLMFRLGDFYELFFEDAETASRELGLTLTGRNCGLKERAPMCGVPFHAADSYISTLVKKGHKVAICEQLEDPATAKGIVKRDVIRVVTPGTLDFDQNDSRNLFIASLNISGNTGSLAYSDVSTGELYALEVKIDGRDDSLGSELAKIGPGEIILTGSTLERLSQVIGDDLRAYYYNVLDDSYYKKGTCERVIKEHFSIESLLSLGIEDRPGLISSVGSILMYLTDTQKQDPSQITELILNDPSGHMILDRATVRNLELLETLYDKNIQGSLLGVLDKTETAMGGRLLKRYILQPLTDPEEINLRLDGVEALVNDRDLLDLVSSSLRKIYDFERLSARVSSGRANAKDLTALKVTLQALPELHRALKSSNSKLLSEIDSQLGDFEELADSIDRAVVDDPPFLITEGGIIKDGFNQELDDLKDSIADAKNWITSLEASEKERTGIRTLKVGYNKVFGYYIDVSKSAIDKVPEEYVRKQTLVNNERYITPELKEKETLVFSAEARINALEYSIFSTLRNNIKPYIPALQKASSAVGILDVLSSFAKVSISGGFVRPDVDSGDVIQIKEGRHPAVEKMIGREMFIPNDVLMDCSSESMLIITGPNMSGKSTYMRQTAVIVLMAQIGCFVPAGSARIGVVDRVFTRIGASDNLAYGQSTFFVEMSELANILRNATNRSLVILDEIGRGTSTFDGLSIAWSTVEYLCREGHKIRTMFATHYHELTVLDKKHDCIKNLSVDVSENGSDILFLHHIKEGAASKSYGIHVAKIAGIPYQVRRGAQAKLQELEAGEAASRTGRGISNEQISIFDQVASPEPEADSSLELYKDAMDTVRSVDVNQITPVKALNILCTLQEQIREIDQIDKTDTE